MAVNSVTKVPSLQVHQNADAQDEKERFRQPKKEKNKREEKSVNPSRDLNADTPSNASKEVGQILDSARTIELLSVKPIEARTIRKHAFVQMTQLKSVNKSTVNPTNKLNKSA